MNMIKLAYKNIIDNRLSTALSILIMAFGVGMASLIFKVNDELETQFNNNLNSIDMVVGAKGSPLQLILSSVYHIDNPTGNIPFEELSKLRKNRLVETAIPVSLGDSYNGFRIVGTEHQFVKSYNAEVANGRLWKKSLEVTVGHTVAKNNHLRLGNRIKGTHGLAEKGHVHDDVYTVVGILERSNSVLDQLILTTTQSVWDVHHHSGHENEEHDEHEHEHEHTASCNHDHHHDHEHDHHELVEVTEDSLRPHENAEITAILVKFKNPIGLLQIPRKINEDTEMQAAVPSFEVNRLMGIVGIGANTLKYLALIIILLSGLSIFVSLYLALQKRKYELALMRVHGASTGQLAQLVIFEGLGIALFGALLGLIFSRVFIMSSSLITSNGILSSINLGFILQEFIILTIVLMVGLVASVIPVRNVLKTDISKSLIHD